MARELFGVEGEANSLWSGDHAPTDPDDRTWTGLGMASLWAAAAWGLPMYLLASGMTTLGMSARTLLGTVLASGVLAALLAVGCGHAGKRYGIPFAVFARVGFGVVGARIPLALRALAGCVWLGIACWLGAESLFGLLRLTMPPLPEPTVWACFALMLLVAAGVPGRGNWSLFYGTWLGALVLTMFLVALSLALRTDGGAAALLPAVPTGSSGLSPPRLAALCITGMLGAWLPLTMGAADLARRVRSHRDYGWATVLLPLGATLFSAVSISVAMLVTRRGAAYWNPAVLAGGLRRPILAWPCLLELAVVAVLTARPLGRWLGGEIANLAPTLWTAPGARWIACGLAAACAPRWWLNDPLRFVGGGLTGCAGLLAPCIAILGMEYFVLRRRWLNVDDLYQRDGLYEYTGGWNWKAFAAVGAGWFAMLVLFLAPALAHLQDGAVWLGTSMSALLYWLLRSGPPEVAQIPPTPLLIPLTGLEGEGVSS